MKKNKTIMKIELLLAQYFNYRQNLIIPNISWGFNIHECDLLIVTPGGYLYEVEIKISIQDLKRDLEKKHQHEHEKIKKLYFCITPELENYIGNIPLHAGIIVCNYQKGYCNIIREAISKKVNTITNNEKYKLARLGTMRIWGLYKRLGD